MVCSKYFFHEETFDWSTAREKCSDEENSSLVSMETEKEWHFVHNLTKKTSEQRSVGSLAWKGLINLIRGAG